MQEAQHKTKEKVQQKAKTISSGVFAVEQAEISEFLDASDVIKEMSEIKEF
jgi:hypothetical protein